MKEYFYINKIFIASIIKHLYFDIIISIAKDKLIKALLFDIDGTLLKCNGAGKSSLIKATIETFGTAGEMEKVDFQGKTDPIILKESLNTMGFNSMDIHEKTNELKTKYFKYLRSDLKTHDPILLPGVKDILSKLKKNEKILLGLLTGNFKESAMIKLEHFSIENYFKFGAYGDDGEHRNQLPHVAQKRINQSMGMDIKFEDMIIIGDTVHDITCAKSVGAVSVAVGTGWCPKQDLLENSPDYFFPDLSNFDDFFTSLKI